MMRKLAVTLTCLVTTFASTAYGDEEVMPSDPNQSTPYAANEAVQPDPNQPKEVGKAAEEGAETNQSHWGKYVIAVGAVAVAIVALILVSSNKGHH
jgi:hypothetical protein